MRRLPRLLRLAGRTTPRSTRIEGELRRIGLRRAFNPSLRYHRGRLYVAMRVPGSGTTVGACLVDLGGGGEAGTGEPVDLAAMVAEVGIGLVADPKLVSLGQELWVTFNTGYVESGNELYLMRLTPEPDRPQRCVLASRRPVEKNWAFFEADGRLYALYSVDPPLVLAASDVGADTITFTPLGGSPRHETRTGRRPWMELTIGSQVVPRDSGELALIAHEKIVIGGRRSYFGRAALVHDPLTTPRLAVSRARLVHSLRAMAGARAKRNPNLVSATYISGFQLDGDAALLGYGINDRDLAVAETDWDHLW